MSSWGYRISTPKQRERSRIGTKLMRWFCSLTPAIVRLGVAEVQQHVQLSHLLSSLSPPTHTHRRSFKVTLEDRNSGNDSSFAGAVSGLI